MHHLTKHEELTLLSIVKLKNNAYGVSIRQKITEITGKSINYGSLCNTIYSLVKRGLIQSKESLPESVQGGRRKVLYFITDEGKNALKFAYEIQKTAWSGISDIIYEGE